MKNLDRSMAYVLLVGLFALIVLLLLKHYSAIYVVAVWVGVIAVISYLLLSNKLSLRAKLHNGSWVYWFCASLISYLVGLILWSVRLEAYVKPLSYYVFMAVATVFSVIAASKMRNRASVYLLLGMACTMVLTHIWTENMIFPSVLGLDPWTHMETTTYYIAASGTNGIPPLIMKNMGGGYSLMHVWLNWIMNFVHIDYKVASLIFWSGVQTVGNVILVYLIGKELVSRKVGLIASLLVANANWVIFFGEWVIPNGIGATLVLGVALLFIKAYKLRKYWVALPSLVVLVVAFFIHPMVSAWVFGAIICFSIPLSIKMGKIVTYVLPCMAVALTAWWISFANVGYLSVGALSGMWQGLPDSVPAGNVSAVSTVGGVENYLSDAHWGELLLNSIGMFVYMGIALVGLLILLKYSRLHQWWVVFCVAIISLSFVPQIFGYSLIEHRWMYLAEVLGAMPLAVVVANMLLKHYVVTLATVGAMVFFSTIGLPSNTTNRTLSSNQIVRYSLTNKEMQGLDVAMQYNPETIGSDPMYDLYINSDRRFEGNIEWLGDAIVQGKFGDCKSDVILLRDAVYKEPFGWGSGAVYRLRFNPVESAISQGYEDVWNNGEIHVLVRE